MKNRRALLLLGLILLVACATPPSGPAPTAMPSNNSALVPGGPTSTPDPQCPTRQLETWIGRSKENTRGFMDALNAGAKLPADQALGLVTQLASFRGVLNRIEVPPCAKDEQTLIFGMMDTVLVNLNAYASHQKANVNAEISAANTQYGQILLREKQLEDLLAVQLNQPK